MKSYVLLGVLCCACQTEPDTKSSAPAEKYLSQLRRDAQAHPACNQKVAVYIDLTRSDNDNRFFLVELGSGKVLIQAPCLNGLTDLAGQVRYSNAVNSNCSSHGLALIGKSYYGGFGWAYHLDGLEASTSNLRRRSVVLHGWAGVPAVAGSTHPIQSQGCPTLNPAVLDQVSAVLNIQQKRVLLRFN